MKTYLCLTLALLITASAQWRPTGERAVMEHDDKQRYYRLHVPAGGKPGPRPLVVVLHGGGHNAQVASKMGFTAVADRENFIVVYPEATDGNWNDGRLGKEIVKKAGDNDDVGFITALVEKVAKEHAIDRKRIYATGYSNGGVMSHRLGIEKADLFAAIAPGIGGVPKELGTAKKFKPSAPVSVLILQGIEDPITPYTGGAITLAILPVRNGRLRHDRGAIIPTDEAVKLWKNANGILGEAKVTKLADRDPLDGCTLERHDWPQGRKGSQVTLIRMIGAGHTVPGARQYLPEKIIGKTCQDADASEIIWEFFKKHPKP